MNDFLNITNSTETSEIGGSYPQIRELVIGYDYDSKSSIFNIANLETDGNYEPDIQDFILSKNSKLTDFLSYTGDFFIVSTRVIELLRNFNIPPNKQFSCTVRQGDKIYPYVIIFFFRNKYDFTDYTRSEFTLRFFKKEGKESVIFKTKENFEKEAAEAYQRFTNIIYYDAKKSLSFDIFKVNKFQTNYFISENLRKTFIENKVSGIDYLDNVDTVFSFSSKKEILEKHKRCKDYFLNRTSYFSNGVICRKFEIQKNVIEEYNRSGKKERELILHQGEFKGSERMYFANGNVKLEKLVKSNLEVIFKYYFNNGRLNYEIIHHDKKGITCGKVFNIDGEEIKGYGLNNGTGKVLHFNANGNGGVERVFKNNQLVKENKIEKK